MTWFQYIFLLRERNLCMCNNFQQESLQVKPFKLRNANFVSKGKKFKLLTSSRLNNALNVVLVRNTFPE